MSLTVLESSTLALAHFETLVDSSPHRTRITQAEPGGASVALTSSNSKFGSKCLDAYNGSYGGLRFEGGFYLIAGAPLWMEAWVYIRDFHSRAAALIGGSFGFTASATTGFSIRHTTTGKPYLIAVDNGNNANVAVGNNVLPLNQWVHLLASIDSTLTRRLYVNGTLQAASSQVTFPPLTSGSGNLFVGGWGDSSSLSPDALIDEARCVFGIPFEPTFTPPTGVYSDGASGDSLLLHAEGSDAGLVITDSSSNALSATQIGSSGNVTTSTARSKFGSSSLRFNGTQAISYATSALFEAASRDWTIDCWVYVDPGVSTGVRHIWQLFGASIDYRLNLCWDASNSRFKFFTINGSGTNVDWITSGRLTPGQWCHVMLVKEGSAFTLWLDGVPGGSAYVTVMPTGNLGLCLGTQNYSPLTTDYWIGNIDEFRVQMGTARQSVNFTPPSAPYADCPALDGFESSPAVGVRQASLFSAVTGKAVLPPVSIRDMQDGGKGTIASTVKEHNSPADTPLHRRVWLLRECDARVIRETWSDASTGNYSFVGVDETKRYSVLSFDHLHNYRGVIADNLTPTVP